MVTKWEYVRGTPRLWINGRVERIELADGRISFTIKGELTKNYLITVEVDNFKCVDRVCVSSPDFAKWYALGIYKGMETGITQTLNAFGK